MICVLEIGKNMGRPAGIGTSVYVQITYYT